MFKKNQQLLQLLIITLWESWITYLSRLEYSLKRKCEFKEIAVNNFESSQNSS